MDENIDIITQIQNNYPVLAKELYTRSYYEFFKKAFTVLLPNEPYSDNWHAEFLCDRLQAEAKRIADRIPRKKDLIINIPFRASKSLIFTVIWPVWCWTKYPSMKFIYVSYSASLALEHAQLSRNLIYSQWFQSLYGDKVILDDSENQKGMYKVSGGGFRKSVGTGGQITGSGADVIVVDDGQSPALAASETERKNTIDFYKNTLYSRLNQPELGVRINVQQRLHEDDLTGHLLSTAKSKYEHICIPVEIDMDKLEKENVSPVSLIEKYRDGLFWPERFSKSVIQDYEVTLGSVQTAGQLYQRPSPKDGNMVKREWFEIIPASSIIRDLAKNPMMFYIDTAETPEQKEAGDSTAIVTCFIKDKTVYIANVITFKKEFYDIVKFVPEYVKGNLYSQYSRIKIEPKSSGKSVVSQLKNTTLLNVIELPTPKDDKITRLSAITPKLESRRVKLLEGAYVSGFLDNLMIFPNGKHDDDVDAFIHAIEDLLTRSDFDFAWA